MKMMLAEAASNRGPSCVASPRRWSGGKWNRKKWKEEKW